jgi:hypothetical protein
MSFLKMHILAGFLLPWSILTHQALVSLLHGRQENTNATLSIPPPSQDP